METRDTGPSACMASTRLWRGVDSRWCKLEVDEARGWTDHLPWSHVEGGAELRGYGVRIQRIEAYSAGKSEGHVIWTGARWSDGSVKLIIGR